MSCMCDACGMEFEDAWLEVQDCLASSSIIIDSNVLVSVPVLGEVLNVAERTSADMRSKHASMWDYSRRLSAGEAEAVRGTNIFARLTEDDRSASCSSNVMYNGSCYTLTFFAIKKTQ